MHQFGKQFSHKLIHIQEDKNKKFILNLVILSLVIALILNEDEILIIFDILSDIFKFLVLNLQQIVYNINTYI
jgi:hypothetical protein